MKIALLGFGKEGQAAEDYFLSHKAEVVKFQDFKIDSLNPANFKDFDLVFRSPSVPFRSPVTEIPNLTSMTRYFFDHCPCPIIGVTATKGKGTTCSFIKSLLEAFSEHVFLVGNIGEPAINIIDKLKKDDVVVYEMSSFQLWDLQKSPEVAVIGTIEPDHLNVHANYDDYTSAKAHIGEFQTPADYMIHYQDNPESVRLAQKSPAFSGHGIAFPYPVPPELEEAVKLPGQHNLRNALAAVAAVASYFELKKGSGLDQPTSAPSASRSATNSSRLNYPEPASSSSPDAPSQDSPTPPAFLAGFIKNNLETICQGLENCKGLPHRLEYLRDLNSVSYYDDNFSTNPASTAVAVQAFTDRPVVLIAGGRDKTDNADLPEIVQIFEQKNVSKVILMGESGHEIFRKFPDPQKYLLAETLEEAVSLARAEAEKLDRAVVLMSPAAASFDMFHDVYDRGDKYKRLVLGLK